MKTYKLAAITVVLGALAFTSHAALSGNITISGTVGNNTRIVVEPMAPYNDLDIDGGETDTKVATVTERCNKKGGYTVTLRSENATASQAFLKGTGSNEDVVNYSMTYGGIAVTLASGVGTVTDTTARTTGQGVAKDLNVTIGTGGWYDEDTYSDTLTLTIAAK